MTREKARPYNCSVCGAPGYAKGLCERDYARSRRGTALVPHALRASGVEEAFLAYAASPPTATGCIEWSGSRTGDGYGTVSINGQNHRAHRVALSRRGVELHPDTMVLHSCDNPPCVNPDHLRVGDAKQNASDMVARERQARGGRNSRRVLSDDAVNEIVASGESAAVLARRFGVSRQHVYKVRSGAQSPWRQVIGAVHPDDADLAALERAVGITDPKESP